MVKVRPFPFARLIAPCKLEGYSYQLDPYSGCEHQCCYCYALNGAQTDWSQEILTPLDIAGQLGRELAAIQPQTIYIGMNSDPYQACEEKCRQTRAALELFGSRGFSVCLLTKSDAHGKERRPELAKRMVPAGYAFSRTGTAI